VIVNETKTEEIDVDREFEAFLQMSRKNRSRLETLREVLTSDGHYGKGATPSTVVYRENKLRLLRLVDDAGEPFKGPPVLFVPAPVSRYFIVDLLPGRTFAGHVANAGFDVFIIDFGEPTSEDKFCDLSYYVDGLVRRSVRKVCALTQTESIDVIGYCLGGTLSLLYTALYPESVSKLVLLTTSVDGDVKGGIPWVAHQMGMGGESYDHPRLVPAAEVKSWFEMLSPGSNSQAGRVADLWDRLEDTPERLRTVRTMASWVDDIVPAPGRLLAELYQQFGPTRNKLMKNQAKVGNRLIDLAKIRIPVMSVSAERDTIAPPEGVDAIGSLLPQAEIVRLPGGHVGIVAGRSAQTLWDTTTRFLRGERGNANGK
jgi:polyhydroxyalkanoate synthase